jgi:hypothetical protein
LTAHCHHVPRLSRAVTAPQLAQPPAHSLVIDLHSATARVPPVQLLSSSTLHTKSAREFLPGPLSSSCPRPAVGERLWGAWVRESASQAASVWQPIAHHFETTTQSVPAVVDHFLQPDAPRSIFVMTPCKITKHQSTSCHFTHLHCSLSSCQANRAATFATASRSRLCRPFLWLKPSLGRETRCAKLEYSELYLRVMPFWHLLSVIIAHLIRDSPSLTLRRARPHARTIRTGRFVSDC